MINYKPYRMRFSGNYHWCLAFVAEDEIILYRDSNDSVLFFTSEKAALNKLDAISPAIN